MTNSVIRHYGTDRSSVVHPVLSHQCRTTMDPDLVTCITCRSNLDATGHEEGCKRYSTGWLCTNTCPVEIQDGRRVIDRCSFALGRGKYCMGDTRFPATHSTACPSYFDGNWRKSTVLVVKPRGGLSFEWGSPDKFAEWAARSPKTIFMVLDQDETQDLHAP